MVVKSTTTGPYEHPCTLFRSVLCGKQCIYHYRTRYRMVYVLCQRCVVVSIPRSFFDWKCIVVAHNLGSETKKATGYPMFMAIGQCGSILGSHIYPLTEGPRYMYVFLPPRADN